MDDVLVVTGLRKAYGARQAVDGVSLSVAAGQVLALLGPNGAGKSTTVGMISGLTEADVGTISVAGLSLQADEKAYKRRIGLVPQDIALFEDLPALDNVELFGALYDLPRAQLKRRALEVLAMVGLADRARDKPATFSGGMKRRLNIACALVHEPQVLLLDEPTAGVDPQSRNAIFEQLEALKRAGMALVYTTHYMEEAERLADRLVIVDGGRVVASGTLGELYALLPAAHSLQLDVDGSPELLDTLQQHLQAQGQTLDMKRHGARFVVAVRDLGRDAAPILHAVQALVSQGLTLRHLSSGRANLEDVFLSLTGRQLRD